MTQGAIIIALAAAGIACTIAKAKIFESLRYTVTRRSYWGGLLIWCPYCTVHWVCIAGCALYQPRLLHSRSAIVDVIVSTFAVISVSCFLTGLMVRLWHWDA